MTSPKSARPDSSAVWLTPEARERLEEELETLLSEVIPAAEAAVGAASSQSSSILDNGDLTAAMEELALAERRASQIRDTLARSSAASSPVSADVVEVGCVVRVKDSFGDVEEYLIAPPENRVRGVVCVSPAAPLGAALLGRKVGDVVSYKAPAGVVKIEVLSIEPYTG